MNLSKHKLILKIISSVVILTFLYSNVAWALPGGVTKSGADLGLILGTRHLESIGLSQFELGDLYLPEQIGHIKETWAPEKDVEKSPVVIHIQDAHANYQAQSNIAKILEFLDQKVSSDLPFLVTLEGADSPIDSAPLKAIANEKIRQDIATSHVKRGFLTGAEYYSAFSKDRAVFQGVDDRRLYLDDLSSFQELYRLKRTNPEIEACINDINSRINNLKEKAYSPELLCFSNMAEQYKKNELSLIEYCQFLNGSIIPGIRPQRILPTVKLPTASL